MGIVWIWKVGKRRWLGQFHEPIKDKELGGHLSGRVVKRVPDSMEEFGKFFNSDHLPENQSGFIELIVRNVAWPGDQLSLDSLQGIS